VWSALLAREGMTGPSQPFEGRQGWWDHIGPYVRELRLPARPELVIQRMGFKRTPTEGSSQAILEVIPQFRAWTKTEEIDSVHIELAQGGWMEIGDGPKWDPRNRETADHSMPYMIARSLMDGELYLDSFTPEKFMDPAARRLMEKITMSANPRCAGLGPYRMTVRKKSGEVMTKEWLPATVEPGGFHTAMTEQDIVNKLNRVCAFMHVADDQRDRARAAWSNLRSVRDIADPMRDLARFGRPKPLTT
jgi:2-methylcitrate dehydratase